MNRLTVRLHDNIVSLKNANEFNLDNEIAKSMQKLAEYEDIGLKPEEIKTNEEIFKAYRHVCGGRPPEEIKKALELLDLEEQGRLKRFHKIGDEVHILYNASGNDEFPVHVVNKCKVKYQYSDWLTDKSDMSLVYGLEGIEPFSNCTIIDFEVWEDDIFSTKEEAEKALEEMNENK